MIRATADVQNPDLISLTVTMTMTIGEWKEIEKALESHGGYWPFGKVAELLRTVLRKSISHVSEVSDGL